MCIISINHHTSCKCTYYILEQDCGASSTSHPSCVQFQSFPVSRWSRKTSYINKISARCGTCSGVGETSDVLARINILGRPSTADGSTSSRKNSPLARVRPDTGLSVHTEASIDSVSSQLSVNSCFCVDGLSRSVSMGIQTFRGSPSEVSGTSPGPKSVWKGAVKSLLEDKFTRPEMEWRRSQVENSDRVDPISCWILWAYGRIQHHSSLTIAVSMLSGSTYPASSFIYVYIPVRMTLALAFFLLLLLHLKTGVISPLYTHVLLACCMISYFYLTFHLVIGVLVCLLLSPEPGSVFASSWVCWSTIVGVNYVFCISTPIPTSTPGGYITYQLIGTGLLFNNFWL